MSLLTDTAEDAQDEFAEEDTADLGEFGDPSDTTWSTLDLSGAGTSLGMVGAGLIGDESDTTTENAAETTDTIETTVTDPATEFREETTPGALAADLETAWNDATPDLGENPLEWGPDWLDEAALALIALAVLFVLRPYMEGANTAADAVT